mmetsp:Transcript_10111/g.21833  ORF Transcript_10111/g.21833 Transcript_10111/m.21833 type:complete len:368 (-) Transcript_10111:257-1360(-)
MKRSTRIIIRSMIQKHKSASTLIVTTIIILLQLASIVSRGVAKATTLTSSSFVLVAPSASRHPLAPLFHNLSTENNRSFASSKRPFPNSNPKSSPSSAMSSTKNNPDSENQLSPSDILESPSAERNKAPIWDMVLKPVVLPIIQQSKSDENEQTAKLTVLELAAGSGVHTQHFVSSLLQENDHLRLEWHPSDPDPAARISIDARAKFSDLEDCILPANGWILGAQGGAACGDGNRDTDGKTSPSSSGDGSVDGVTADGIRQYPNYFDLILCINMIHIAPWEATLGLMECAGKVLKKGGMLVCYGPYKVGGTAVESNLKFDEALRSRNPSWGVRNLEEVIAIAKKEGLEMVQSVVMPANNLSVLFRKA